MIAYWRGKDCNDRNKNIRPGVTDNTPDIDSDCNGIFGRNARNQSYEEIFCKNSKPRQIITFGDSG